MAMSNKRAYVLLYKECQEHPVILEALNQNCCANASVCPVCHVDDFTHVEGCIMIKMCDDVDDMLSVKGKYRSNYNYIRIIHEGVDYIKVVVGKKEYEIEYPAAAIIKVLIRHIRGAK